MLCATCRRQVASATVCGTCGTPAPGAGAPLQLVLADGTRVPIVGDVTLGRSPSMTLCLDDPTVSRAHARIAVGAGGATLEDTGSSYGTYVDGAQVTAPVPLRAGAEVRLGDQRMTVQTQSSDASAGRTIVVPVGASLMVPAVGAASLQGADTARRPRLRSGYALKRLDASEGDERWVVRRFEDSSFLRLSDADGRLLSLLDGSRTVAELLAEAERMLGVAGLPAVMRLLGDLGERGMLADVQPGRGAVVGEVTGWRRLARPRERPVEGLGRLFSALYRRGGWVLFTRPVVTALCLLAVAGLAVYGALIAKRYGTPFVVAHRLALGGAIFLAGRLALVVLHELAHGLAMESVGRPVRRAGLKLLFVFPYAFVDTSEVWFEPRRRRQLVTVAGPLSDFALAGLFAIICLVLSPGTMRDICFQVATGGYIAALFNLNPFLERDGYHLLADGLRVPGLRAKARASLRRRLSGAGGPRPERALIRYAWAGVGWSVASAAVALLFAQRYKPALEAFVPEYVVWGVFGTIGLAMLVPAFVVLGPPLVARARGRGAAEGTA